MYLLYQLKWQSGTARRMMPAAFYVLSVKHVCHILDSNSAILRARHLVEIWILKEYRKKVFIDAQISRMTM